MNRIFMVFLVAVFYPSWVSADLIDYCKSEWPDDYSMQEYCIKDQGKASKWISAFSDANQIRNEDGTVAAGAMHNDAARILAKCVEEWPLPKFDAADLRMVAYCVEQQVKAYNRINTKKIPLGNPE